MKKLLGIALALLLVATFSSCDQILNLIIPKIQLTVTQPTGGYITVSPNKTEYTKGETVTITATAMTGYRFENWTGGYLVGSISPQSLTLNSDATVSAVFGAPISRPIFSPVTGTTLSSGGTVTITSSTSGATIRYTTDGTSEPTLTSGTTYTGPIAITATTTIKAVAISGSLVSDIASATYYVTASAVATPAFSPSAGTYTSAQNVTLSCSTSGATIRYTTDGTTPSSLNGYTYYAGYSIPVSNPNGQSVTIKAYAWKSGLTDSSVASATYTFNTLSVLAPQFYPSTGTTFSSSIDVYISSPAAGSSIRYTTDGSVPTSTYGTVYNGFFTISATTTVKAIAYTTSGSSSVTTATYTKSAGFTAAPAFSPVPGYYTNSSTAWTGTVTLSSGTSGAVIHYTTDGTTPTSSSSTYSAPFAISGNMVVEAYATSTGNSDSSVVAGQYYVPVANPVFTLSDGTATTGGDFSTAQSVSMSTATSGANIRYTTDGSTPTDTVGTTYSGSIYVSSTTTLKAVAYKYGNYISSVASATFNLVTTGTISGTVRDASSSSVLSGVALTLYNSSSTQVGTTQTSSSSGTFSFTGVPAGTNYKVTAVKTGYLSVDYTGVSVTAGSTNNLETIYLQSTATLPGSVSGYITNAANGYGETGVTVALRTGIGNTTGTTAYTATTGTNGLYSLSSVTPGTYTASISKTGFTTSTFTITVVGNTSNTNQNSSITPTLLTGNLRFVLTWGASPSDLDSHLKVPLTSTTFYHVYYSDKGYQTASPYATLDVDDTSSYGPETTTIYTQLSGTYTYYVHDFTNRSSTSSTALSSSGAKVVVYQGSTILTTYNVPTGTGTLWKVCSWNGYSLTPINTMENWTDPSTVQNRYIAPPVDGEKPDWRGELP
ncbi:MAG: chitobiase/beta-hexosaminidase C-terminal domain-containing protein [Spirochaetes bacterium]|nr:chitobiase/beta-hexosaminidase C-terminal domain-containing protein [Spirochaetota bacterium]